MPRYLIVANLTLGGEPLLQVLKERVGQGDARFHVLAPASHGPQGWRSHDAEQDAVAAHGRLRDALQQFRDLGADEVTGEMGTSRPVDAVGDVIRANSRDVFDEIILSTLPAGPSRWLAMDLPTRLARAHKVPVTHVVGPAD
ncbi:hypothetical protein BH23ACT9_BH23ACT9_19810 [soil metagenome]